MKKYLILLGLSSLFLFTACGSSGNASLLDTTDSGRIEPLETLNFDWGNINIQGGNKTRTFKFKNAGEEDLIIKSAQTTCMCTTAKITLADGNESPSFEMHADKKWGGAVKPGEEFSILVTFDPLAHGPDGVGPISRSVFLDTSSVPNGEVARRTGGGHSGAKTGVLTEMRLSGNVMYEADFNKLEKL